MTSKLLRTSPSTLISSSQPQDDLRHIKFARRVLLERRLGNSQNYTGKPKRITIDRRGIHSDRRLASAQ